MFFFFFERGGFELKLGKGMCLYIFESDIGYILFLGFVSIIVFLIFIIICYVKVFCVVLRLNCVFLEESDFFCLWVNVEEVKVIKILLVVLVGFVFCWLLIFVIDIIDVMCGDEIWLWGVYIFYVFLFYMSSIINLVIYGVMNK